MTNEQSLQNIEVVKKLIHLYQNDYVYLKFKSATEFEIIRLPKYNEHFHDLMLNHLYIDKLPYAHLWQPPLKAEPYLRYIDSNLDFFMNLTTNEYTICYEDTPIDIEEARNEFQELIGKLK